MSDKEKVAKSLTCTKVCRNVVRNKETGEFGVCRRKVCTFAHSDEELQPPHCSFDHTCRFKYGRNDHKTRIRIPGSQCKFRHSNETIEEYYKRSGTKHPDLPPTSEKTREIPDNDPKPSNTTMGYISPLPDQVTYPDPVPYTPKSYHWDYKTPTECLPYSDDDSSSCRSDLSGTYDHRRSGERSPRRHINKSPSPQIIRVPTKELAEIAIKASFDRGQYNVRIIVE